MADKRSVGQSVLKLNLMFEDLEKKTLLLEKESKLLKVKIETFKSLEDEINKIKSTLASLNIIPASVNNENSELVQLFPYSAIYLPALTMAYLKKSEGFKLFSQHIVPVICNVSDIYRKTLSGVTKCKLKPKDKKSLINYIFSILKLIQKSVSNSLYKSLITSLE